MKPTRVLAIPLVLVACGTAKPPGDSAAVVADSVQRAQAAGEAAPPPPPLITATTPNAPTAADTGTRAGSATRPAADTTKPAAAAKTGDGPLRDSAYGPKFRVDSTGKVTPIKKP